MTAERRKGHRWQPIVDLTHRDREIESSELDALTSVWATQRKQMEGAAALSDFMTRMVRSWSIETGILERIYTLSEGVTVTLLELGFDSALISHGDTDIPPAQLIAILRDHQSVAEGLFDFVRGGRPLSTSYVKELHQQLTRHQLTCQALDGQGNLIEVPLRRGDWKIQPNNPGDPVSKVIGHEYCPPEHVAAEMDRLIAMHLGHTDVRFVVSAAWLHHRFTQIHPFQDGNGRVARALASLVCIRAGGFPLVILRQQKKDYITALERADDGDLSGLIALFQRQQRDAFVRAISLSSQAMEQQASVASILADAKRRLDDALLRRTAALQERMDLLSKLAVEHFEGLENTIRQSLGNPVKTDVFKSKSENSFWFRDQVVSTAKEFDYYANPSGPKAWVHLRLKRAGTTGLVVSFHHVGRIEAGVMAATAFLTHRNDSSDEDPAQLVTQTACTEPFTFTAGRDSTELSASFRTWLDRVAVMGLDLWRRLL